MTTEGEKSRVTRGVNKHLSHVQLPATMIELFFKSQNSLPLSLEDIITMMSGFTTYCVIPPVTHRTGKDRTYAGNDFRGNRRNQEWDTGDQSMGTADAEIIGKGPSDSTMYPGSHRLTGSSHDLHTGYDTTTDRVG